MLTPRQAFKAGFLKALIDQGLSAEEMLAHVDGVCEKLAFFGQEPMEKAMQSIGGTAKNLGLVALLAGPPAIGAALGYGAAKLTDTDDTDADEVRKRELIDQYKQLTQQAQLSRVFKDHRQAKPLRPQRSLLR